MAGIECTPRAGGAIRTNAFRQVNQTPQKPYELLAISRHVAMVQEWDACVETCAIEIWDAGFPAFILRSLNNLLLDTRPGAQQWVCAQCFDGRLDRTRTRADRNIVA